MEAFVTVAIISSIVQLVDFSSRCVSKSIELHQSASGVLEDNASIGLVLDHLVSLNDELAGATASGNGVSLQELCKAVSETATELADVLRQLKVCGQKTRWKTMRKAIRSVWSKEKVQELEKRLATFRDELNLHVVVKIREQLCELRVANLNHTNEATQKVLDAIIAQQDIFSCNIDDQKILVRSLFKDAERHAASNHTTTRKDVKDAIADATLIDIAGHETTRRHVTAESAIITQASATSQEVIVEEMALVRLDLQGCIDSAREENSLEHESTQTQIAELKEALRLLSQQITERDEELKRLLTAFNRTRSPKKRKLLGERSNAVTAALMALETMYRSLQAVLAHLQASAKRLISVAQSKDIWRMTGFARRTANPLDAGAMANPGSRLSDSQEGINMTGRSTRISRIFTNWYNSSPPSYTPGSLHTIQSSFIPHTYYYSYYYSWLIRDHGALVDLAKLEKMWPPRANQGSGDNSPFNNEALWLLVAVTAALEAHLPPGSGAEFFLSKALDFAVGDAPALERLGTDKTYWHSLVEIRRMICNDPSGLITCSDPPSAFHAAGDTVSADQKQDLLRLLRWVLSQHTSSFSQVNTVVMLSSENHTRGPAYLAAKCLQRLGLRLRVTEVKIGYLYCSLVAYDRPGVVEAYLAAYDTPGVVEAYLKDSLELEFKYSRIERNQ